MVTSRSDAGDTFQAIAPPQLHRSAEKSRPRRRHCPCRFPGAGARRRGSRRTRPWPVTQGEFLVRLGVETRALTLMAKASHEISEDISGALQRLIAAAPAAWGRCSRCWRSRNRVSPRWRGLTRRSRQPRPRRHEAGIAIALGHSGPASRVLHARGRRVRRKSMKASMAASVERRSRSRRGKPPPDGTEEMGVEARVFFSACIRPHSPDVVVATGPWQGAARPLADAIVTRTEGLAIGATAADCGPILLVDPNAARDRGCACGLEGRADRIVEATVEAMENSAPNGRHRRRDRTPDPPTLPTKSAANSSNASSRPTRRMDCSSLPPRARAMRCSISPASSGCGSKTPAC